MRNGVESTRELIPLTGCGERLGGGGAVEKFPPCTAAGMHAGKGSRLGVLPS